MMNKVTKIDRPTLRALRAEMEKVLAKFGEDTGLKMTMGSITYGADNFRFRVDAALEGAKTMKEQQRSGALDLYLEVYGLQTDGVGGRKLIEYNTRGKKYPFIYTQGGKRYKTDVNGAKLYFKKAA